SFPPRRSSDLVCPFAYFSSPYASAAIHLSSSLRGFPERFDPCEQPGERVPFTSRDHSSVDRNFSRCATSRISRADTKPQILHRRPTNPVWSGLPKIEYIRNPKGSPTSSVVSTVFE